MAENLGYEADEENVIRNRSVDHHTDGVDKLKTVKEEKGGKTSNLTFKVDERPPFHIALFYAFQMVVSNLPGNVSAVFLIHSSICGGQDYEFLAKMLASSIGMTGVASLLQVLLGSRLPVAQGSAFSFFPPIIALMNSDRWRCPDLNSLNMTALTLNGTVMYEPPWKERIRYVSGGMIFASLVQVLSGSFGLIGFLTNFIGPLTIAPCVMLIGLSLWGFIATTSQHQWGISLLAAVLTMVFSVWGGRLKIPTPTWTKKEGFHLKRFPILRMFSSILAMAICWLLCYVLTVTGRFPDDPEKIGYLARTDAKVDAITKMDWFYFPYPGQFGVPLVGGVDVFIGMLAATLSSIIESIGDYYATARVCELPPPPKHAMNRGIASEGFASLIAGLVGTCHGTTSLSQIVGFIAYTGVASRITWIMMSIVLIFIGIFGKLTGAIATIPDPIIGGVSLLALGLVISVGISQLHSVDMDAVRNQMTLGMALLLGIMLPSYLGREENREIIQTGVEELDQVLSVFLQTAPFVGGVVGCIFDNLLPGTKAERGMAVAAGTEHFTKEDFERADKIYNLPFPDFCNNIKIFSWIPCLPCYIDRCEGKRCCHCGKKGREDHTNDIRVDTNRQNMDSYQSYNVEHTAAGPIKVDFPLRYSTSL